MCENGVDARLRSIFPVIEYVEELMNVHAFDKLRKNFQRWDILEAREIIIKLLNFCN